MNARGIAAALLLLLALPAGAAIDAYAFDDADQERRYFALVEELRCPKCLNTNLAGSDSPISADLRREVHRLVVDGKSDSDIREHLVERYGDFILYRPRLAPWSVALYVAPLLLVLAGFTVIVLLARRRRAGAQSELNQSQAAELQRLLGEQDMNRPRDDREAHG